MEDNLFEILDLHGARAANLMDRPKEMALIVRENPGRSKLEAFLATHYPPRTTPLMAAKYRPFKIDDRGPDDVSRSFCEISLAVPDGPTEEFILVVVNLPECDAVRALLLEREHERTLIHGHPGIRMRLTVNDHGFLRRLADAVGKSVSLRHLRRTGEQYLDPNWIWVAKRVKKTLYDLSKALREFRQRFSARKVEALA